MKYTLVMRGDPRAPKEERKVFAAAQSHSVVSLEQLAKHITQHGCVYGEGDIQAVTTILAGVIVEQLKMGNQVELGKLGKFYVTLDSKGADTPEDFDPNRHIQGLRPKWSPSKEFSNLRASVSFEQAVDRRTTRRCLKENRIKRQEGKSI
ncbi:MAG: hypothetical protein KBT39_00420 [Bacteroidales bacterium]|nr:hypothetical protein [Bacteroidales bacterium]